MIPPDSLPCGRADVVIISNISFEILASVDAGEVTENDDATHKPEDSGEDESDEPQGGGAVGKVTKGDDGSSGAVPCDIGRC